MRGNDGGISPSLPESLGRVGDWTYLCDTPSPYFDFHSDDIRGFGYSGRTGGRGCRKEGDLAPPVTPSAGEVLDHGPNPILPRESRSPGVRPGPRKERGKDRGRFGSGTGRLFEYRSQDLTE